MKYADVQKLHDAGLITGEQRQKIVERFNLKEDSNHFLVIISFVGAILIAAGVALLIAAHWEEISRGIKLAGGILFMLGAHGIGWWLREVKRNYTKTGEALQLVGSLLFLGNIVLVGQIYHIESRTPDAFLLWWLGIAALPWLFRSQAQFALLLVAFGIWFGAEINESGSPILFSDDHQVLAYALMGAIWVGLGYLLRRTSYDDFATVAEKFGLLVLLAFSYPLTWAGFLGWSRDATGFCQWLLPAMCTLAAVLAASGCRKLIALTPQWRWTWGVSLVGAAVLLVAAFYAPHDSRWALAYSSRFNAVNGIAAIALFVFCLLQIQVGIQERSTFLVNFGVVFIALDIVSAYFGLFGTMARTGLMFVVSGVFLIVFGVYLEKKRRALMKQIKAARQTKEGRP